MVESLRNFFLSVADLIVDGRNTYKQPQCSPHNNSNSQPENTWLYLHVSTTLALLPAIPSSICLEPSPFYLPGLLRPARSTDFCQYSSQGRGITVHRYAMSKNILVCVLMKN